MEQKDKYTMYRFLLRTLESVKYDGKIEDYDQLPCDFGIVLGVQFRTSLTLNELNDLISNLESHFSNIGFRVSSNGLNPDMDGWNWDLHF